MKSIITTTAAVAVTLSSAFTLGSACSRAELASRNLFASWYRRPAARRWTSWRVCWRQAQGQVGPAGDRRRSRARGARSVWMSPRSRPTTTLVIGFPWPDGVWPLPLQEDAIRRQQDLVPIVITTTQPNVLAVNGNLPVKNVAELVAYARRPTRQTVLCQRRQRLVVTSGDGAVSKPRRGLTRSTFRSTVRPQPRCRRRTATRNCCLRWLPAFAACAERQDSSDRSDQQGPF